MTNPGTSGASPDSAGWQRLSLLFERTLAQPPGDRLRFIDEACAGDPAIARELRSLLEAEHVEYGPLESLAGALGPRPVPSPEASSSVRIGPYGLVRELGRGGMGLVYLARRADGQYTRDVALKLAQNPMFDAGLRERFYAERDILARLSHRNIASLYDGGVTEEGHPYFTMEYVDGRPIDVYCEEERLDVPSRVRLFLQICEAVAAAHRSLVVHRDLKPSNVLVDASASVKLLDFGIAKLLDPLRARDETQAATRMFTRDYASPEQVQGLAVTTASDVYSLGALLYRLLAGTVAHRFDADTPAHVEHVICEVAPLPPSQAVSATGAQADRVRRALEGDLDNIVLKALSKDPVRRYASVDLFAQDLDHYLRGRPVAARADSAAYRAGKFVLRHRIAVGASLLAGFLLVAGAITTTIQARRARIAAVRAQRISMLVTDLFKLAEPGKVQGGAITAKELLDRGSERIAIELAGDPDAQATMYGVVGNLYRDLALSEPAARMLERALELRRQTSGSESLQFAAALDSMADLREERGEYRQAEQMYREALALRRRLGAPPIELAASLEGVGRALSAAGKHVDAEAPLVDALAIRRRHGDRSVELVQTLHELALAQLRQGDGARGEPLFREAVELGRRLPAASAGLRVKSLLNLARLKLRFEGRAAEAEPLYREALDVARRSYPSSHPDIATSLGELAGTVHQRGRLDDAETLAAESLQIWRQLYGPRHREVITATQRLALVLADRGKTGEAEVLHRTALADSLSTLGDGHPLTLTSQDNLAAFLQGTNRRDEAARIREAALEAARRAFGEVDVYVARAWAGLGQLHATSGDDARAERELRRALEIRKQLHPAGHWRIGEAEAALGAVLTRLGHPNEAEALLVAAVATLGRDGRTAREKAAAERHLAEARRRQ